MHHLFGKMRTVMNRWKSHYTPTYLQTHIDCSRSHLTQSHLEYEIAALESNDCVLESNSSVRAIPHNSSVARSKGLFD